MSRFSPFNAVALTFGFAFLYLPIMLLVVYSFNENDLVTVWTGFSFKWYGEMFANRGFRDAAWVTIRVALISSTVATVLGMMAAVTLVRAKVFFGRTLFTGMVYTPLVMPEVITGISLLLFFVNFDINRGMETLIIAHITFTMAFATVVISSRFQSWVDYTVLPLRTTIPHCIPYHVVEDFVDISYVLQSRNTHIKSSICGDIEL